VCCADIDAQGAGATARAIEEAGGRSSSCRLDVTSEESWRAALDQVTAIFSRLDVLVNSAGISFARPVTEMSLDEWRRVIGLKSAPGASAYSASKAAVCMFVKAAARECLQNGDRIRINTVCRGWTCR
jgi:NAD(P)-dependent dehydrogenase (short-subunit alcohol dehydrogenase family)